MVHKHYVILALYHLNLVVYTNTNMARKTIGYLWQTFLVAIVGVFFGSLAGLTTLAFIRVFEWIQQGLWTSLPQYFGVSPEQSIYPIIVCAIGGVLVGLASKYLGNYPRNLQVELAGFAKTKEFDYRHIPQTFVNSLLSLGFGAALGPEAALTTIVGGLSTWISKRLKFVANNDTLRTLSISGTFGALFGSPLGSSAISSEVKHSSFATKLQLYLGGLVAATIAFWIFSLSSATGGYFNLDTLPYTFNMADVLKALLPALVGFGAGLVFLRLGSRMNQAFKQITSKRPVIAGLIGGLLLGSLAALWPLILFSGHEGIQSLMTTYALTAGGTLVIIGLVKSLATTSLLATGWKGGQFFPVMFIGAAVGLGISQFIPSIPPMVGIVAGMTAMLGCVINRPIAAGVLVLFFFPPSLYPSVLMSMLLANLLLRLRRSQITS